MTATSPPTALSPPAAPRTARTGPVPALSRPGARTAIPGTRPAASQARSCRHDRSPGPARPDRRPARFGRPAPVPGSRPAGALRRRHPVGLLCATCV